jgi:hypothetical protein
MSALTKRTAPVVDCPPALAKTALTLRQQPVTPTKLTRSNASQRQASTRNERTRRARTSSSENECLNLPAFSHCEPRRTFVSEAAALHEDGELESSHLADLAAVQLLGSCLTVSPEYIVSDLQEPWL